MQAGAGHGTAIAAKNWGAGMFVIVGYSTQIFVNAAANDYKGSLGLVQGVDAADYITYGGTASVHERSHRDGSDKSEHAAYTEQLRVLQKFGPAAFKSRDFYNNAVTFVTNGTRRPD
jgi:hypothetical protein